MFPAFIAVLFAAWLLVFITMSISIGTAIYEAHHHFISVMVLIGLLLQGAFLWFTGSYKKEDFVTKAIPEVAVWEAAFWE